MNSLKILSVKIDQISKSNLLDKIVESIDQIKKLTIYTVNNEFIVEAQKNHLYREVLNRSSISIADSTGIVWAGKKLHDADLERIPGADLFMDIARLSSEKNYKIFLLGAGEGVAEKAANELKKKFTGVNVVGTFAGKVNIGNDQKELIDQINNSSANIVCVALGSPKQETWIDNNFKNLKANVFIGIGGTLDYVSGTVKRAPLWMRRAGLEWLYRLFRQPSRAGRIYKALVIFPLLVRKQARG